MIDKSKSWEKINSNSRTLFNNVWGMRADETLTSGIYSDQNKTFGWYWNRLDPKIKPGQTYAQPIYPNIRTGGSPWEISNSTAFPIKLSEIKSLTLDVGYNYPTRPDGQYDLAYDMFFTETNKADPNPKLKAEVMIWLHATAGQPEKHYKGDLSDGNNTFMLYSWTMADGRIYYSLVMKGETSVSGLHTVNAKSLLDQLGLETNLFVPGIEFGNEVWKGSGKIEISRFSIILNGSEV
jgi:hypothetical protein